MNLNALGAFVALVSIPGAISRYYWIRPELTQAGFKNLGKGSLISLSMQVASIAVGIIGMEAVNSNDEDKRFNIAYTIMMVASIPAAIALAGRLNFKLSYEEAATTAALCWASFMGLLSRL